MGPQMVNTMGAAEPQLRAGRIPCQPFHRLLPGGLQCGFSTSLSCDTGPHQSRVQVQTYLSPLLYRRAWAGVGFGPQ